MRTSKLYLGEPLETELALRAEANCDLGELHWFAQRVCQCARGKGTNRERLLALLPRITERCGSHFMAHLTTAVGHRALGQQAEATLAWQRARALTPSGHRWAAVVPDEAQWDNAPPVARLVEEERGRVYRLVGETRAADAVFATLGVGRFLRVASGEWLFINPVPVPPDLRAEIRALGPVTHIVAPAKYHSEHLLAAHDAFPGAKIWGVPAHRGYSRVAHVPFDGFLDDGSPLFPGEIDQVTLHGNDVGDVWLLDRASGTLLTTDALFFTTSPASAEAREYRSFFSNFYAWAWGVWDRNGVPSYQPPMWRNLSQYQAALRRAFSLEFEHVAYSHGSWRAISADGRSLLQAALGWILNLTSWDGMRLTFDFVKRHPRVVYEALRQGGA